MGTLLVILPLLRPWWYWHWDEIALYRDLLGDRIARIVFIALGLVLLFLALAPGRWLAWLL
jgi:hypothetical protein